MHDLRAAVADHRALVQRLKDAYPAESEESLADTIEAATELDAAIVATVRAALELRGEAEALDGMIAAMLARKRRKEETAAGLLRAALHAMQEAGWKRLPTPPPDMSVTVTAGKPKLLITDADALPFELCRAVVTPDKAAIRKALEAGQEVPGAVLGNAEPGLVIHRR